MIRRVTVLLLAFTLILGGAACSSPDDGQSTGDALAKALSSHTVGELSFDAPSDEVQKALTQLSEGVDPVWPAVTVSGVEVSGETARVSLNYSWQLPHVDKPWSYATGADMKRNGNSWTITWSPEMVEPKLAAGDRLEISTLYGQRASILSADGEAIVKDRPVRTVGINKEGLTPAAVKSSTEALATLLEIDVAAYQAKAEAYGPVAFVDAITLREEAFQSIDQTKLKTIDGVLATEGTLPLAPTRIFASAILGTVHEATAEDIEKSEGKVVAGQIVGTGGLQASFDSQLAGTPGVTVLAVASAADASSTAPATNDAGTSPSAAPGTSKVLFQATPGNGKDVKTTLVPRL